MTAPTNAAALALRDIHLPPPPSWWPPAPGWWLLAVLVIALVAFAWRWWRRALRDRRWRRRVHAELDRIAADHAATSDRVHLASQVSQLLRRAARLIDPEAASLRGEAWLQFLDSQWPSAAAEQFPFQKGIGQGLADLPYRRGDDPALQALDARALLDLARRWLNHVLARRQQRV